MPLKALVSESDHDTLISAFASYRKRLAADWMFVLDLDGMVMADTLDKAMVHQASTQTQLVQTLQNSPDQETYTIVSVGAKTYQVVVVPLKAPTPVAWVGIGFEITDKLAIELEQQTKTQVTLAWRAAGAAPQLLASTLSAPQRRDFLAAGAGADAGAASRMLKLGAADFVAMELPLVKTDKGILVAALQRSMDEALAGYRQLRWQLLALFLLSTVLAVIAAVFIARRVTRPVLTLAHGAERISAGFYDTIGDIGVDDEFGTLASAFDDMVRGLIERDQVHAILGKVVSPAIAEELLSRRIDIGGQEREVSVLFSDIRGFTTLCEGRAPTAILTMLNTYLSEMSAQIDQRAGVVDKYIGDAVMALFGAPIGAADDPQRALETALAMVAALPALNQRFGADGWPPLRIGIGIHSGIAVAGNVGSLTRLNYTVLGDAVNLAARIENLCKLYGVPIVVSETTMARCSGIAFRELDRVRVKGKREPVTVFEAIGREADLDDAQRAILARHAQALQAYRAGQFSTALAMFNDLPDDGVTTLFRTRCAHYLAQPPATWDGVATLDEK